MLFSIFHAGTFDARSVTFAFLTALILGIVISIIYHITAEESGKFTVVIAAMPLLISAVILIVNGNLGTSVAVLGAFGLVRFRSAAGTAWEIAFLFFTMAVGLAVGMGFISLAVIITLIVGTTLLLLDRVGTDKVAPDRETSRSRSLKT